MTVIDYDALFIACDLNSVKAYIFTLLYPI